MTLSFDSKKYLAFSGKFWQQLESQSENGVAYKEQCVSKYIWELQDCLSSPASKKGWNRVIFFFYKKRRLQFLSSTDEVFKAAYRCLKIAVWVAAR